MTIRSVLLTGANRGIGFELCKQLSHLSSTEAIIATTRSRQKSFELNELSANNPKIHVLELEVRDHNRYDKLAEECHQIVGEKGLNLLVNNAGVMFRDSLTSVTAYNLQEALDVNTIAPLMLTHKLLPLLKASANNGGPTSVANISAAIASMAVKVIAGQQFYSYRISKAALNMVTRLLAFDLEKHKINAIGIHPGWVKTDMGTKMAPLEPEVTVKSIVEILLSIDNTINGKLVNYDRKILQF